MSVSERLKQARTLRDYSQDRLAKIIGTSRGVIANIEYGKTEPQPIVAMAICDVLKINKDWLLYGKGEMDSVGNLNRRDYLIEEIQNVVNKFSEEELDYAVDMIKLFKSHRDNFNIDN